MGSLRRIGSASRVLVFAACAALSAGLSCSGGATGPTGSTGSADTAVAAVHVVVTTSSIYVGQSTSLTAVVLTAGGDTVTGRTVTWASSDTTIASVTTSGVVTGRGAGGATITATVGSVHGSAALTVALVPIASVTIAPKPDTLLPGQVVALSVAERDAAGNLLQRRPVTWTPTDTTVATVSSTGLVTAHDTGAAYIVASVASVKDSAQIVVRPVPVVSVTVTPSSDSLFPGDTVTLVATAKDTAGNVLTGRVAAWASTNAAVATVGTSGRVTAQDTGSTYIRVTIDSATDSARIVVREVPVAAVVVAPARDTLLLGDSVALTATALDSVGGPLTGRPVTWTTGNASVAAVSANGIVTTHDTGAAYIRATIESVADSALIVVRPVPVASVAVTPALDSLVPQDTVTLGATAYDSVGGVLGGRTVTWASSGPSIATVSAAGLVTAQDTGTAYVIATIESMRDSAKIVVHPAPVAGLLLAKKGYGVATGDSVLVTATALDAGGRPNPYAAVTWTSRDPSIASVDSAGYVTGRVAGETDVIATSGGFTDSTHVLVGACATTQSININHFVLPIEAGGQWNSSGLVPSGQYRTNGTVTSSGVAFGTDGSHLALGTNITGTWDTGDIALDPVCAYQTTAVNRTLVDLTVASTVGLDSLDVVQETWAVPDQTSPTASYILFRYTFTNESAQALTNFHAAYLADWDIQDMNGFANPAQNLVRYDSTTGVGEATGADTVNYPPVFGVVPVAASGAMNFKGWASGTGTPGDPQTDADIFAYLSAGIDTTVPSTATDIRELMGVGPVTIPAGGRYVVYFGVLGADDQTRFDQFVTTIRVTAQGKGF